MTGNVPSSLYWPDTQEAVIMRMQSGVMPAPFVRRMRLINVLSAVVLGKLDVELIAPFDLEDIHHILDKQISQDAIIDQLKNDALAEALMTGNLEPLYQQAAAG